MVLEIKLIMGLRKKIIKFFYNQKFSKKNYSANLNNKNILITGANSGIGLALTKKVLSLNNNVLATYRDSFENLQLINDKNLSIVKFDQRKIFESKELEKKIKETSIDLIFNCAGVLGGSFDSQKLEKLDFMKFQEVLMVNSFSILRIIQIILSNKSSKKNLEALINISSSGGSIKQNNQGNAYIYRASKNSFEFYNKEYVSRLKC